MAEERRTEGWIDGLPLADQPRARLLAGLPASMAVARVDRDVHDEMRSIEDRLGDKIAASEGRLADKIDSAAKAPVVSKRTLALMAVIGGAVADGVMSIIHSAR